MALLDLMLMIQRLLIEEIFEQQVHGKQLFSNNFRFWHVSLCYVFSLN